MFFNKKIRYFDIKLEKLNEFIDQISFNMIFKNF